MPRKSLLKPWITDDIIRRIDIKNSLSKLAAKGKIDPKVYSRFKNKVTSQIRRAKAQYYDQEFVKCEGDVKKTWKIINNTIRNKIKNHNITIHENNQIVDRANIPNKFINYFSNKLMNWSQIFQL